MPTPNEDIDFTNCDKEPIHIIGGIQAHGFFLAFRPSDRTVYHASANAVDWLGKSFDKVVGRPLNEILPEGACDRIFRAAENIKGREFEFARLSISGDKLMQVLIYDLDGLVAIEFEEHPGEPSGEGDNALAYSHKRSLSFVEDLHANASLEGAARAVCRAIRSMIGFERVMMYRYLPSWDGEVIAEDKSPEAHSFLHHRFPATDIPLPARQLYLKNRTRQIVDSSAAAVPIEPPQHYLTRKPIDLSNSKLRAVSPVHLSYLRNMEVRASFSVAIIVDGNLWGLVACHGKEPAVIPLEVRLACETLASTFAVMANMMETLGTRTAQLTFEDKLRKLFQSMRLSNEPLKHLMQSHTVLEDIFAGAGIGLAIDDHVEIAGLTPPVNSCREIAAWLRLRFQAEHKTVLAIESLTEAKAEWSSLSDLACGVLAISSPESDGTVFMIFRPELLRSVVWGGDPRKTMEKRRYQGPINPRASFESWTETVSRHSSPWLHYEIQGAAYLRDFVFDSLVRKEKLIQALGSQLNQSRSART
jgi:light-regulated signal transduction histidine kinase (bacteriophytochrome)